MYCCELIIGQLMILHGVKTLSFSVDVNGQSAAVNVLPHLSTFMQIIF